MFIPLTVPGNKKAQQILSDYLKTAYQNDELERTKLAKKACDLWRKENIPFPPPAVPERSDYWYLVQLFSLKRHVHRNCEPYLFDLGRSENILIEDFPEADIDINNTSGLQSRDDIDKALIDDDKILDQLNLDSNKFKVINIPFDIYLRISNTMNLGKHNLNTYFDGYRLRSDKKITGLFGGNGLFGGTSFIDSFWTNTPSKSILKRLVVIRKDYGY